MAPSSPSSAPWRAPVQIFSMRYLAVVPVLLAVGTAIALFARSDVNAALLWSQCHAHELLPSVGRVPVLGTPSCYLVSFFREALDSLRSTAIMGVILAFVGALLAVSTVEAARPCNASNAVIANPTAPWLLFNLLGGAVVWQLLIVPAFIIRAKTLFLAEKARDGNGDGDGANPNDGAGRDGPVPSDSQHTIADDGRSIPDTELVSIPLSVGLGYFVPSGLMLFLNKPVTIAVWLFFPAYVSIIRQASRAAVSRLRRRDPVAVHLESSWRRLVAVYAVPALSSLAAHGFFIWNMTRPDDRKEMTRSTLGFIEIDFQFIGWTVLYWVFVEVGWKVPAAMAASTVVLGPGAATCMGWMYREKLIHQVLGVDLPAEAPAHHADNNGEAGEDTPLLRG